MSDNKDSKEQKINIELDDSTSQGIYSNLAVINHSPSEFVVDFVVIMPGNPKAKVRSRIILTPEHAKRFKNALEDNIKRYENINGDIKTKDSPNIPLNFGPVGEA